MTLSNNSYCFVCGDKVDVDEVNYHPIVHLPCCNKCKGTEAESQKVTELIEGLSEGFVCGCI